MTYTFIVRACPDLPVAVCCRVMKVSTSAFYAWLASPVSETRMLLPAVIMGALG